MTISYRQASDGFKHSDPFTRADSKQISFIFAINQ